MQLIFPEKKKEIKSICNFNIAKGPFSPLMKTNVPFLCLTGVFMDTFHYLFLAQIQLSYKYIRQKYTRVCESQKIAERF